MKNLDITAAEHWRALADRGGDLGGVRLLRVLLSPPRPRQLQLLAAAQAPPRLPQPLAILRHR